MSRPRVLIVEDERVVAMDLERSLVQLGYSIIGPAASGGEAIRIAGESCPDLVLMDIGLAGDLDGIAAAAEIRRNSQIPVVFITANADDETLTRARATEPYGYLLKPIRIRELNATILMALHQHRLVRELFAEHTWLRTTMSSLSDGVIATDGEGRVRYLNPAAERLTGWSLEDAVHRPIEEVYSLTTISGEPVEQCQVRRALAAGSPVPKQRFLLCSRDGRRLPIEDSAAPMSAGEQVLGAVTVFLDITDQLRRERQHEAERDRLEERVQNTTEALGQTRAELRALSAHLLMAQEAERRRVARELHDDLAQRAAIVEMRLEELVPFLRSGAGEEVLCAVRAQLGELSTGLREVSHRLHPSAIEDLGLVNALRGLVDQDRQLGGESSFSARRVPAKLPLTVATALYRIAQEALRNATKYARGAPVRVSLLAENNELHLTIEDAGPGFNLEAVRGQGGLGLLSMQERARLAGGNLLVRTRPGDGTLLLVRIPIAWD